MKKLKLLLLCILCVCLHLYPAISHAEEIESNYTFRDFCCYWSYGYNAHHIYPSDYLINNNSNWTAINTDLDSVTGRLLVIGDEDDEEDSSISYTLCTSWSSYKNVIYTGNHIPEKISFEYITSDELAITEISDYDLIIIELIAKEDTLSESSFITLDQLVKNGQYVVFDTEINNNCVYTEETDGSVAVIDTDNYCLLISSNNVPGYFANLHSPWGTSGNTITLAQIANTNNTITAAQREAVRSVKILPTYNSNILTNTFYTWYDAEEVFLPSCIDTISNNCFEEYSSLGSVNLNNVKAIGNSAFQNCNFSHAAIPDGVQTIGSKAFYQNSISEVEIPSSVSSIGSLAFGSNPPLDILSLHVNENGTSLGNHTFYINSDTELYIVYDGETSGNKQLFSPFTENDMEVTADNFNNLIETDFTLSFAGIEEISETEGDYTVTFVDNKQPAKTYTKQVINGNAWGMYLKKLADQEYSSLYLIFKGWIYEDGTIINENDIVDLNSDITIYSLYECKSQTETYTVNFPEYNKTIEIHYGDVLDQYDIPNPQQTDDTFLGWTQRYPINDNNIENILTEHSRWWITSNDIVNLYGVWKSDLDKLTTTETLSMIPNYYLNRNNTGHIYSYTDGKRVIDQKLNDTKFSKSDEENSQSLLKKILKECNNASKICIVPSDYKLNIKNAQKNGYHVIKSGLSIQKLQRALTLINCKYFQYLLIIQTPYVDKEKSLNKCTDIGYEMTVTDWEIIDGSNFEGWVYGINTSKFMKYYNICSRTNKLVDDLVNNVFKFNTETTVVDALKAINDYLIQYTAYDNPMKIYDLKWFLEETSKSRNLQKEASHHGVCASYSKLAHAVLGKCGYETLPCAVWESAKSYAKYIKGDTTEGPVHSINKVIIGSKTYYCDFCWASSSDPMRYMFLTLKEVNQISCHYHPVPDNYGKIISFKNINNNNLKEVNSAVTIIFNTNGGTSKKKRGIYKNGHTIGTLPVVSKKGFIFKGWYTKKSGGKKIATSTKITSNMTLYAHWSKVTVKKSVIKNTESQKKKEVTIDFKKITGAEGYQIQYSISNKFTKNTTKSVTIKGNKTFSKKLTKLAKKTYYIRVRAYKIDSTKEKVYGKWSKTKKATIKK